MIKVKAAATRAALAAIDGGIDEIARILERLREETALLESRWNGEAREAMSVAVREWNTSIDQLRLIGRDASRAADQTVERVDAFDRRRASAWHR